MEFRTKREALPTVDMTRPPTRQQGEAFVTEFERRAAACDRLRTVAKTERLRASCERNTLDYRAEAARIRALLPTLEEGV